jgi:hypothetical protein
MVPKKDLYRIQFINFRKADRLSLVHDAEYVGERIPFYSTPAGEEGGGSDDEGKKQKKAKQLSFPSVTLYFNIRKNQYGTVILLGLLKSLYQKILK